jgi:hypothetical protein
VRPVTDIATKAPSARRIGFACAASGGLISLGLPGDSNAWMICADLADRTLSAWVLPGDGTNPISRHPGAVAGLNAAGLGSVPLGSGGGTARMTSGATCG